MSKTTTTKKQKRPPVLMPVTATVTSLIVAVMLSIASSHKLGFCPDRYADRSLYFATFVFLCLSILSILVALVIAIKYRSLKLSILLIVLTPALIWAAWIIMFFAGGGLCLDLYGEGYM